jgi:hypothetical protein
MQGQQKKKSEREGEGRGNCGSIPDIERDFSLHSNVHTYCGVHKASYSVDTLGRAAKE